MLECPACNKLNPNDHQFCGYCGNRLPATFHTKETLPPWLADTSATQPILAQHAPPQTAAATHADDAALPPWLQDAEPVSANGSQPPGQREAHDTSPANEHDHGVDINQTALDLPFWLEDHSVTAAPTDAAPHRPVETAANGTENVADGADTYALPAWLTHEAAPTSTTTTPAWQDDQPAPPEHATDASLADAQPAMPEQATTTAGDDALPPWLFAEHGTLSGDGTTPAIDNPFSSPTSEAAATPSSTPAPTPAHDDSLGWLLDAQATPTHSTNANTLDELPDWLRDDMNDAASPPQTSASSTMDELPAWLRDDVVAATSSNEPTPPTAPAASLHEHNSSAPARDHETDSLPAWLRDDPVMPAQAQIASPDQVSSAVSVDAGVAGDTGAMLTEQHAAAATTNEELPAWLRDEVHTTSASPAASTGTAAAGDDGSPPAPAATAHVYDAAAAQEPSRATEHTVVPEQPSIAAPAVYETPEQPVPSVEDISALIAAPTAASTMVPAAVAQEATPPLSPPMDPPVVPAPAPPSATPVVPQQPAQRGNGWWIMLVVVLILALLAVGWLALRFNNII